jgi:hypothetical protein
MGEVLFEKIVKKLPTFYEIRILITVSLRARYMSVSSERGALLPTIDPVP